MIATNTYIERWRSAKKRVTELKDFHNHVVFLIGFTILLYSLKGGVLEVISQRNPEMEEGFLVWLDYNFMLTPVIWGVGILIHGLYAYRHKWRLVAGWEEKHIRKLLESDQDPGGRQNP